MLKVNMGSFSYGLVEKTIEENKIIDEKLAQSFYDQYESCNTIKLNQSQIDNYYLGEDLMAVKIKNDGHKMIILDFNINKAYLFELRQKWDVNQALPICDMKIELVENE